MCIVSIYSEPSGDFILTQNRDESVLRPSTETIETREVYGEKFTGPVDLVSNGTWIYYSQQYVCCILNGAYKKHSHRPPYRKSRGLVILDLLQFKSIQSFIDTIDLEGIEPFSMIMIDRNSREKKILVWDEIQKHTEDLSGESLIVRSSTPLYTEEEKATHKKAFQNLLEKTPKSIFQLQDQIKMLENNKFPTVQSTSITQIITAGKDINLKFCPILK